MGGESFHADGRTDGQDEAFPNFGNAPKKDYEIRVYHILRGLHRETFEIVWSKQTAA